MGNVSIVNQFLVRFCAEILAKSRLQEKVLVHALQNFCDYW